MSDTSNEALIPAPQLAGETEDGGWISRRDAIKLLGNPNPKTFDRWRKLPDFPKARKASANSRLATDCLRFEISPAKRTSPSTTLAHHEGVEGDLLDRPDDCFPQKSSGHAETFTVSEYFTPGFLGQRASSAPRRSAKKPKPQQSRPPVSSRRAPGFCQLVDPPQTGTERQISGHDRLLPSRCR